MSKKLYIETLGCAMNVRDSEHIIAELNKKEPYDLTNRLDEADLIIINTCSVREKPVSKLFSEIGVFRKYKKPDAKIGVAGCTASHLGREIIKKAPVVDFVIGARNISKLSKVIDKKHAVEIDITNDDSLYEFGDYRTNPFRAMINISIGCDKSCTYCIVPATRGEEISIPKDIILKEVERAVKSGAKEVVLLGQNVNNYGKYFSDPNEEKINFTELLREVSQVEGLERIRFSSPHPLHMDDEFLEEFAKNPKICKQIHIPLQSGSTKVLRDMKRGYTKEWFLNRCQKVRELVPDVAISTDIIVGFPAESDEDFKETMDVLEKVRFEQIFSFKYSPRPHTKASNFPNQIPDEIASKRLTTLQNRHKEILDEIQKRELGKIHKVYFDELKADGRVSGRTDNGKLVIVKGSEELLGKICDVEITKTALYSFEGRVV
jgi:tRNA-2-methylthio-N6-dimethylallyladenosine synthase